MSKNQTDPPPIFLTEVSANDRTPHLALPRGAGQNGVVADILSFPVVNVGTGDQPNGIVFIPFAEGNPVRGLPVVVAVFVNGFRRQFTSLSGGVALNDSYVMPP